MGRYSALLCWVLTAYYILHHSRLRTYLHHIIIITIYLSPDSPHKSVDIMRAFIGQVVKAMMYTTAIAKAAKTTTT
jgi:hypothetical protein